MARGAAIRWVGGRRKVAVWRQVAVWRCGGVAARLLRLARAVSAHEQRELRPRARHGEHQPQRHRAKHAARRRAARDPLLHDSLRALLRLARAAYPSAGGRRACARAPLQRELHAELGAVGGGGGRAHAHELEPDRGLCSV